MELAADANCDARDLLVVLSSREIERRRRSFSDMSIGSERVDAQNDVFDERTRELAWCVLRLSEHHLVFYFNIWIRKVRNNSFA